MRLPQGLGLVTAAFLWAVATSSFRSAIGFTLGGLLSALILSVLVGFVAGRAVEPG